MDGVMLISAGGGGLANVVEDTTPQLGGDLDVNGHDILLGIKKLKTTNLALSQEDANVLLLDNGAGSLRHLHLGVLYPVTGIQAYVGNNNYIRTALTNGAYTTFGARPTDGAIAEVARLQGAAVPYFQATLPIVFLPIATASLPASPVEGMLTYDATLDKIVYYNGAAWVTTEGAGGGDVTGPASSTDNEIARQHSTTGKVLQTYTSNPPTISDTGDVNIDGDLDVENIVVSGLVDGKDVSGLATAAEGVAAVEAAGLTFAEEKGIEWDNVLSADGKWSGIVTKQFNGGATIPFGEVVYLKAADSEWYQAKADATATSGAVMVGICVLATTDGNPCTVLLSGKVRADAKFPTFTISAPIFISAATAGLLTSTAPTGTTNFVVRIVGHAGTGDEIYFNPSPDYLELA